KMQHDFEIYGTKGALVFSQERLNEIRYYCLDDPRGLQGFRTITLGPDHTFYARFCPAPAHQLGFNDLKAIEIMHFINAVCHGGDDHYDFAKGDRILRLCDYVRQFCTAGVWVDVPGT
ncbi:MAG: gfo/Idh/MocA family oxidoreductase, partial [Pseudomonadota bacterium]